MSWACGRSTIRSPRACAATFSWPPWPCSCKLCWSSACAKLPWICPRPRPSRPGQARRLAHPVFAFRQAFDVVEDAQVNALDDMVGPQLPVGGRPHVVLVPGRAFEAGAAAGQGHEQELAATADQIMVQVRRL